jgi:hypothetical protein
MAIVLEEGDHREGPHLTRASLSVHGTSASASTPMRRSLGRFDGQATLGPYAVRERFARMRTCRILAAPTPNTSRAPSTTANRRATANGAWTWAP